MECGTAGEMPRRIRRAHAKSFLLQTQTKQQASPKLRRCMKTTAAAQQAGVSHFILQYKRLQQRRAGPIPIRICRTVQHAPLRRVLWISLQAHTVGCGGHRDLLGNSPHYKPHPHNSVKVYDIIRPCHRRALQSEPKCTC